MKLFGRLNLDAFKHDWIEYLAGASMFIGAIALAILLTRTKKWRWLWDEWITTVDHKKIGIMYIVVSFVMLLKGLFDAVMMRGQQMIAVGGNAGYLEAEHYQQLFTAHGVTMIFFVGMGVMFGIINLVVPLQIGARDVAFPFLNSLSFWLFVMGAMMIMSSLVVGFFAGTGWSNYTPLAGIKYNPGVGVDYWLWSVQISGAGSLLSGVNFLVTILKMRCPGMTLMRMPVFVWATLVTMVLVLFAFPILTAAVGMLTTDRLLDMHIFTAENGGNPMLYINLFWAWGHPEVYILVLPAFGIFSEVVPVFSQKKLFGYTSMVWALVAITFLSFIVWLHHFFTMGAGPEVNAFFGIMTAVIAIPTGVKVFNWIFTMVRGRVKFTTPMLWFIGFIFTFVLGGATGVLMSIPAADFQIHNSLFLIAHFHNVIIGGVLFGFFAGYTYWFPKFTGFILDEKLGRYAFWCWLIGFFVAFLPLYLLGFMGATRRLDHYDVPEWQPLFIISAIGALIIVLGVGFQALQLFLSIKHRNKHKDKTGDPWNGRTLEWSTSSPPPFYNFAHTPEVHSRDAFWVSKQSKTPLFQDADYHDIHMPKNSPNGFYIAIFSFIMAFGLIWYMYWLAVLGFIGMLAAMIKQLAEKEPDYDVHASEIEKIESKGRDV
ncbi:MAG TPA: cytochrome o ubiquinol oxidase subunit I [Rhabdochlamydiaceae bacterium]|nr:cytochrome o ubiquinol oxidase subunit I [Rhabdochlamydiaceae bacterium]